MKLLIDENISYRLVFRLVSVFPDTKHVKDFGLIHTNDHIIFVQARALGFDAIVTMDDDFQNILLERGVPPKIIWIRTGNCSTQYLADVILRNETIIRAFVADPILDSLEIFN